MATVRYADETGASHNFDCILDWEPMYGREALVRYGTHESAQALREISKTMKAWRESPAGGLRVFTRDGEKCDERIRERREERRARRQEPESES